MLVAVRLRKKDITTVLYQHSLLRKAPLHLSVLELRLESVYLLQERPPLTQDYGHNKAFMRANIIHDQKKKNVTKTNMKL